MYLTYEEYQDMGGTLDETTFNDIEFEAESYIDWITFNRLQNETDIPEKVTKCMFHIMKLLVDQMGLLNGQGDAEGGSTEGMSVGAIASQSNDGVSISYNVLSAKDALELGKAEVNNIIHRYLQGVTNSLGHRLLYRGIYPDE